MKRYKRTLAGLLATGALLLNADYNGWAVVPTVVAALAAVVTVALLASERAR